MNISDGDFKIGQILNLTGRYTRSSSGRKLLYVDERSFYDSIYEDSCRYCDFKAYNELLKK